MNSKVNFDELFDSVRQEEDYQTILKDVAEIFTIIANKITLQDIVNDKFAAFLTKHVPGWEKVKISDLFTMVATERPRLNWFKIQREVIKYLIQHGPTRGPRLLRYLKMNFDPRVYSVHLVTYKPPIRVNGKKYIVASIGNKSATMYYAEEVD